MPADAHTWLKFAAADLAAARLLRSDDQVPSRIACFHAQQAAEKALKAVLISYGTAFRKTHDVVVLAAQLPAEVAVELDEIDVLVLQPWAVDGRYPGDLPDATPEEAGEALAVAEHLYGVADAHINRHH
jgi:HEPN domain-containing protein